MTFWILRGFTLGPCKFGPLLEEILATPLSPNPAAAQERTGNALLGVITALFAIKVKRRWHSSFAILRETSIKRCLMKRKKEKLGN